MKTQFTNFKKQKKLLVLLPFLIFFLVLIFYQTRKLFQREEPVASVDSTSKLNRTLPAPNLKEKEKTKLEAYMQSREDSLKRQKDDAKPAVKRLFFS